MSQPTPTSTKKQTILLALSGPSSSGKTTLARLLHHSILPKGTSTILHLDDFYLPEPQLPRTESGLLDWDSAESLDLESLERVLIYARENHGCLPGDFVSKEDSNAVGKIPVGDDVLAEVKAEVEGWWPGTGTGAGTETGTGTGNKEEVRLVIVDGFLLLGHSIPQIRRMFDIRILLRARYSEAKARREARSGYATIEGWWQDPPGYVDEVVWPAFVREHGYLFVGGDVEGDVDLNVAEREAVKIGPWGSLEDGLRWVVGRIREEV